MEMDSKGILVRTDTKKIIMIHPMTDPQTKVVYFPVRPGYAVTLHKVQGATLPRLTLWLDKPYWPAAAYVALSRVGYDADWDFVGAMTPEHFIPSDL